MKVKANKKIYDVLEFTNNRDEIENFAGKSSIVKTRINGAGFLAQHEYAIDCAREAFWITPETVVIKNSQEQIFCMPKATFNEIFGKKGKK